MEDAKPFTEMSDDELKIACHERMLRTVGSRATILARLARHTARGGGVNKNYVTYRKV